MENLEDLNKDVFSESFNEFENSKLHSKLKNKYKLKPYFEKYKTLKNVSLVFSYLVNFLSALTAATLVYFFVCDLTGSTIISVASTSLFLVLIEIAKRKAATTLFKEYLQFKTLVFALSIGLVALCMVSISFSYFGATKLVHKAMAAPKLIDTDSVNQAIQKDILIIDNQIKDAQKQTYGGKVVKESRRTIATLTNQRSTLLSRLSNLEQRNLSSNDNTLAAHTTNTNIKAEYFALITIVLDLSFLFCCFFLEYYDYRTFIEYQGTKNPIQHNNPAPVPPLAAVTPKHNPIQHNNLTLADPLVGALRPLTYKSPTLKIYDSPNETLAKLPFTDIDNLHTGSTHTEKRNDVKTQSLDSRFCGNCDKDISTKRKGAKFCSDTCRREKWTAENGREPYLKNKK